MIDGTCMTYSHEVAMQRVELGFLVNISVCLAFTKKIVLFKVEEY